MSDKKILELGDLGFTVEDFEKFVLNNFRPYDRPEDADRIAELANQILREKLGRFKHHEQRSLHMTGRERFRKVFYPGRAPRTNMELRVRLNIAIEALERIKDYNEGGYSIQRDFQSETFATASEALSKIRAEEWI